MTCMCLTLQVNQKHVVRNMALFSSFLGSFFYQLQLLVL